MASRSSQLLTASSMMTRKSRPRADVFHVEENLLTAKGIAHIAHQGSDVSRRVSTPVANENRSSELRIEQHTVTFEIEAGLPGPDDFQTFGPAGLVVFPVRR